MKLLYEFKFLTTNSEVKLKVISDWYYYSDYKIFTLDWGDGFNEIVVPGNTYIHKYPTAGYYKPNLYGGKESFTPGLDCVF